MRRLRGGAYRQGAGAFYPDEGPERLTRVGAFRIDETPVTNRQFARFVAETGHVTFAELPPDPAAYPGMAAELAHPGSLVFTPPQSETDAAAGGWWRYVVGADWRHPSGPDSEIEDLADHPVVHVVATDAEAYCLWAGGALPTEAEWEYAARGGLEGRIFAWGDELTPAGRPMAKIWQGTFPVLNLAPAGLERTAPVRGYPPNGYGLFDMIGNVWEWTADAYDDDAEAAPAPGCCASRAEQDIEANRPVRSPGISRRVLKGGSHLCAPNYCQRYRPAARWAQPVDTSTSHLGFRCVVRSEPGPAGGSRRRRPG